MDNLDLLIFTMELELKASIDLLIFHSSNPNSDSTIRHILTDKKSVLISSIHGLKEKRLELTQIEIQSKQPVENHDPIVLTKDEALKCLSNFEFRLNDRKNSLLKPDYQLAFKLYSLLGVGIHPLIQSKLI